MLTFAEEYIKAAQAYYQLDLFARNVHEQLTDIEQYLSAEEQTQIRQSANALINELGQMAVIYGRRCHTTAQTIKGKRQ